LAQDASKSLVNSRSNKVVNIRSTKMMKNLCEACAFTPRIITGIYHLAAQWGRKPNRHSGARVSEPGIQGFANAPLRIRVWCQRTIPD
jgi:hypothetical protein